MGSDLGTFVRTEGRVDYLLPTATETASFPASLALMETPLSLTFTVQVSWGEGAHMCHLM